MDGEQAEMNGLRLSVAMALVSFGKVANGIDEVESSLGTVHRFVSGLTLDVAKLVRDVDPSRAAQENYDLYTSMLVCAYDALGAPVDRLLAQLGEKQGQGEPLSQEEATALRVLGPALAEQHGDESGEHYYNRLARASLAEQEQVHSLLCALAGPFDGAVQAGQHGIAPLDAIVPLTELDYLRQVHRVLSAELRGIERALRVFAMVVCRGGALRTAQGRVMMDAITTVASGTILPMFNQGWQLCLSVCLLDPAAQAAADQCNAAAHSCWDAVHAYVHSKQP